MILCVTGLIAILCISAEYPLLPLVLAMIVLGAGLGIGLVAANTEAMNLLPKEVRGVGMGVFFTFGFLGRAVGVVATSTILTLSSKIALQAQLVEYQIKTHIPMHELYKIASGALPLSWLSDIVPISHSNQYYQIIFNSFLSALFNVNLIYFILVVVTSVFVIWLHYRQRK
ncbi:unnamed protein product [marine sediment metagenome]|uniref:Major facilitator superfamily (MFS) profile domain-containing protein n=1 Tax=marine sediment metagenome TaxID=412755 RepID=X0VEX7_9ZZZZ